MHIKALPIFGERMLRPHGDVGISLPIADALEGCNRLYGAVKPRPCLTPHHLQSSGERWTVCSRIWDLLRIKRLRSRLVAKKAVGVDRSMGNLERGPRP